jgi:hypothetical protein
VPAPQTRPRTSGAGLIPLDEEDPASLAGVRDAVEGVAELLAGAAAEAPELFGALRKRGFALVEEGMNGVWIPVAASPDGAAAGVVFECDGTVRASVRTTHLPTPDAENGPAAYAAPSPEEDELVDDLRKRNGGMLLDGALRAHGPDAARATWHPCTSRSSRPRGSTGSATPRPSAGRAARST